MPPTPSATPSSTPSTAATTSISLPDGRTARLRGLGGARSTPMIGRLSAELPAAVAAVTGFWGPDWPREIVVVVTESTEQFRVLAHGSPDIAAATTADGIVFAPGAADMSDTALRIVVRHELFHYAARGQTVADAPLWGTEGVADYVGRPAAAAPGPERAELLARLPEDTDLQTTGAARSLAYDRAWWFSRYIADRYGPQTLRALYLRACGPGHPDPATAVRETLHEDIGDVLVQWRRWMTG
ncbi:peptidase [Mycobacterium adipatum]|uniref:peptidase n=1 Tax=Mycobacterium adipatum TaxID=1682113 RepID=UPI0012E8AB7D|nr:peptidase [Mycobacterium adipatum]